MLRTTHLIALQLSRNLASSREVEVRIGGRRLVHCSMEPPTDSFGSGSKGLLLKGDDGVGCVCALVADTIPSVAETIHLQERRAGSFSSGTFAREFDAKRPTEGCQRLNGAAECREVRTEWAVVA